MRDYFLIWTAVITDDAPIPTAPPRAGFFMGDAGEAQPWIDLYLQVGGYTSPSVKVNGPRWYGLANKLAVVAELNSNSAWYLPQQPDLIINGSQGVYEPKTGFIDVFIASPRSIGYSSIVEET